MKRQEKYEAEQRAETASEHHVLMCFEKAQTGWRVRFKPVGSEWVLRSFTFTHADKISDLYARFGSRRLAEDIAAFEYGLKQGKGAVELRLGTEQYSRLR